MTDFSVDVLSNDPDAQALLYSPTAPGGAHLNWLRLPISGTDFSSKQWTWAWDAATHTAKPLARQWDSMDLVGALHRLRPDLNVVATSWSAPKDMKDPKTEFGGALKDETAYAELLKAQATWLQSRGVPLRAMTLGNEPGYPGPTEHPNYLSMTMTDDQMARMANTLAPTLHDKGIDLWALDHNWQDRGRVDTIFRQAPSAFSAVAFHCYKGNPGQMAGLPAAVPPLVTECTGENDTAEGTFTWDAHNLVADAIRAGSTGLFTWNLALDAANPAHPGGCPNCRGVLTVRPKAPKGQRYKKEPEFYTLAHLARAADPGSKVIGVSQVGDVPAAAFANGNIVGVFGHNDTTSPQVVAVRVLGGQEQHFVIGPGELFTMRGPIGEAAPVNSLWGRIIRSPEGIRYYVDGTGYRHFIRSEAIFQCNGGAANTIDVGWGTIGSIPETEQAECFQGRAGDIIRHPDGDSYVLEGGANGLLRHWIPSAPDFACARAEGRSVIAVTRYQVEEIASGPDRPGGNCIIRGPGGDAHFVNNEGRREWIPDSPTWDCEIGRHIRVLDVPTGFVDTIDGVGWHYCLNQANLVNKVLRHADGDSHYIHPDNTRTWIPDSPTWDCRMRQGVPVVDTRWREYVNSFRDTGWDYCFDPAVFRNKVLRHADGDAYFVFPDDTKTWVPDTFTWSCRMNQGVPVVDTRWREYVNQFRGDEWDYCYDVNTMKGRIVSHPDGDSHYIDADGIRHWIPSTAAYDCLRARGIPADTVRWRDYITRTPEREWAVCGDTLQRDQKLDRGQSLLSADGRYRLIMQGDGNFVLYNAAARPIWATNRGGQFVVLQGDGNLVEYPASGPAVWASNTVSSGADRLVVQSDGNVVLYAGSRAVWATNTVGR